MLRCFDFIVEIVDQDHVWEPISFSEVTKDKKWQMAMNEKMDSISQNQTWIVTKLPLGKRPIITK
jgi:hypothetical protein